MGRAAVCGQFWRPLEEIARLEPRVRVFYSLGRREQLAAFRSRLTAGLRVAGVSIAQWLLDEHTAHELHERELLLFTWTVNEPGLAQRLVANGADGIISDRLQLLATLP